MRCVGGRVELARSRLTCVTPWLHKEVSQHVEDVGVLECVDEGVA